MTDCHSCTELSILVPVLNELDELPGFFSNLEHQQGVHFQLLICDGGSTDGSRQWLEERQQSLPGLKLFSSPAGRARQLNRALARAQKDWLLFLHIDSRFADPFALKKALQQMIRLRSRRVAGHFALKFRRDGRGADQAYYFYEWKARLGFAETIHGDQGFLLHRDLINEVGSFDEHLPVMEDTDFADRLSQVGQWQLLPAEISTSARRFDVEGLWQRQLLGALIMCFRNIGWNDFFAAAPTVYRQQAKTDKLKMSDFFELVRQLMRRLPLLERWRLWFACGCYVRQHGWQLFLCVDSRNSYRSGLDVGQGETRVLDFFLPVYTLITDNLAGRLCATVLLRGWFEATCLWLKHAEKK